MKPPPVDTGAVLGRHTHTVQQEPSREAVAARVAGLISLSRRAEMGTGGRALGTVQPLLAFGTHTWHRSCTGLQAAGRELDGGMWVTALSAVSVATATGH